MTTMDPRSRDDILGPVLDRLPASLGSLVRRAPRAMQAARDVTAIVSAWTRKRPVSRRYGEPASAAMPGERRLRVLEVRRETRDALSLVLERPADMTFLAGQFLTLVLHLDGQEVRRSYSLSSSPLDRASGLVITIKRVEDGLASRWLSANARPGMKLRVRGPSGSFVFEEKDAPPHLLLIAGGSGITPIMGILRTALAATPDTQLTLVYANRSEEHVIFRDELSALAAAHPRFSLRHVLEETSELLEADLGRVERAHLERALARHDRADTRAYVCGPAPMMELVTRELASLGIAPSDIRVERFASLRTKPSPLAGARRHRLVTGSSLTMIEPGKTVLEGALAGGIDLDFSCTMGGCGACKARLVSGEVELEEPNCLSPDERAAGMILTCVARPLSDITLSKP